MAVVSWSELARNRKNESISSIKIIAGWSFLAYKKNIHKRNKEKIGIEYSVLFKSSVMKLFFFFFNLSLFFVVFLKIA